MLTGSGASSGAAVRVEPTHRASDPPRGSALLSQTEIKIWGTYQLDHYTGLISVSDAPEWARSQPTQRGAHEAAAVSHRWLLERHLRSRAGESRCVTRRPEVVQLSAVNNLRSTAGADGGASTERNI
jgi:hypothetical protein